MRIVAGRHRGRQLAVPEGLTTRPTADRVRQAVFDMLWHAPWAGRAAIEGARVLDCFAGTGALGLEALSRGAAFASFIERDRAALAALRANIAACREEPRSIVLPVEASRPPRAQMPCTLLFLDAPYGKGLTLTALQALSSAGWVAPDALLCCEIGRDEALEYSAAPVVAERAHGAARMIFLRAPSR